MAKAWLASDLSINFITALHLNKSFVLQTSRCVLFLFTMTIIIENLENIAHLGASIPLLHLWSLHIEDTNKSQQAILTLPPIFCI